MNDKQDAVDVTVNIDEGQPLLVEAIEYQGFDALPARPPHRAEGPRCRCKENAPLDRALAQASRETALDEVKDHGFPYATVRLTERPGSNDHARIAHARGDAGHAGALRRDRASRATPASATTSSRAS